MKRSKEELEQEANREILNDLQDILNKHAVKYMRTSAFMIVNKCVDELVNIEQYLRMPRRKDIKVG